MNSGLMKSLIKRGGVKEPVWIGEISEDKQQKVIMARNVLIKIADNWSHYPFWMFVLIVFILLVLMMSGGVGILASLGYDTWKVVVMKGLIILLFIAPLSKLMFLKKCKKYIDEMRDELEEDEGKYAYYTVMEKDVFYLRMCVNSAMNRGVRDWLFGFSPDRLYAIYDNPYREVRNLKRG